MKDKVYQLLGFNRPLKGDVGIEVEMETDKWLPDNHGLKFWRLDGDGSLRGHSGEWVLNKPLVLKESYEAVDELKACLEKHNITIRDSFRAGVHVHVNVQNLTLSQLRTFAALYFVLEELLVEYCGDNRVGNLYCLRATDAEYLIDRVAEAIRNGLLSNLHADDIRYASLNFKALAQYGSLEFRAMSTKPELSYIKEWAGLLVRLRDMAVQINDPTTILEDFSVMGDRAWVQEIVGHEFYEKIKNDPNFERGVWNGMRNAQDFIFFSEPETNAEQEPVQEGFNGLENIVNGRDMPHNPWRPIMGPIRREWVPEPMPIIEFEDFAEDF